MANPLPPDLPTGVVTFLMTDVVGSSSIWRDSPHAAAVLGRQEELVGEAIAKRGGVRPADQGEGDSTLAVFARPRDALAAACDAQRALAAEAWPGGAAVQVRMAVHTGEAELRDARNYGGLALIRCARLRTLASGGQVLVSSATAALARERLPEGLSLVELDTVPIADFVGPERVSQLCHAELPGGLVPLRRRLAVLPSWPTPLVGREAECRELASLVTEHRVVTVTGAGGAGKTRLALAVAEALREGLPDGAVWVELARLTDPEQVAGAVAAACGAHEVPGGAALDVVARHLAHEELLLVLDNCEHLLAATSAVVDAIVRAAPRVRVLATSREPLGVEGETSWRIPSLALPEEGERDPERLRASDAVRLFTARAQAARADFVLDAESAPLVTRICRRLDGIPLALELAAARARSLSLARLADGLDDRFRLLTGGARTAMARQRTLLASVDWSHALLDEEERVLFRRLAVFGAPFSLEAAEAVAADDDIDALSVLDLLAHLVDKSLVVHTGDRYRLLETIRQYALERAADAAELETLRDRHLDWFRLRARGWRLDREIGTTALVAEAAAEAPDLIAAAEWGAAREGRLPGEIVHALAQVWAPDSFHEARTVGSRLLGALPQGSLAWLEGLAPISSLLVLAGEASWVDPAREAMAALGASLGPSARGLLEAGIVLPAAHAGSREAQDKLVELAELGRRTGNAKLEALRKLDLALLRAQVGDPAGARPLIAWLERNLPPESSPRALLSAAAGLEACYGGNLSEALRISARVPGTPLGILGNLTVIAFWSCDGDALERTLPAVDRWGDTGAFRGLQDMVRGQLHLVRGELHEAAPLLERAAEGALFKNFELWVGMMRAELAVMLGDPADAAARLAAITARLAGSELHYQRGLAALLAADIARLGGDRLEAESHAQTALAEAQARGMSLVLADALEVLAVLAGDRDDLDAAARLLGAAEAFRARSGYRWRPHHRRAVLEALRAGLAETTLAEGAALSLADAAAYASRGRGERGRPDHGWESLTPSEQRVVELVAEGLPNAAIAKRLFVSLATVKTHLVHAYGKLGLETRAELAAAATKRRLGGG